MMILGYKYFTAACTAILLASTNSLPDAAIATVNHQAQEIAQNQVQKTSFQPNSVFKPILAKLKQKTRIGILLPQFIPESDEGTPIYAILEKATRNQYEILLGFSPDCTGGTACRLGVVTAETVTRKTPRLTGKPVALAKKITGYFVDYSCGANCSDATLTWRQRGVQYTVGLKAGDRAALIKMANSAINP